MRAFINSPLLLVRQQQYLRVRFSYFRWFLITAATTSRTRTITPVSSSYSYTSGFISRSSITNSPRRQHYFSSTTAATPLLPTFLASSTRTNSPTGTADSALTEPTSAISHPNPLSTMTTTATTTPTTVSASASTSASSSPKPQQPSFYRRPLPTSCIAFSSQLGRNYLQNAMQYNGLKSFFHLMEQYTTQSEPAYCGISTLVIALNALQVDPRREWKKPWRWYQEEMLNCCVNLEQVKQTGITMSDFACLAICQGLQAHVYHVEPSDTPSTPTTSSTTTTTNDTVCTQCNNAPTSSQSPYSSLEHFRSIIKQACMEKEDYQDPDDNDNDNNNNNKEQFLQDILIVSYNRAILTQTGSGHFSPIAAYDKISDTVLILDTARFKYGAHWVPVTLLYNAMQSLDPTTSKPRGYILLHVDNRDHDEQQQQQQQQHEQLLSHMAKSKKEPVVVVTEYTSPTPSRQTSSSSLLASPKQAHPDALSILVRFKLTQESKRARKEFQSKFLLLPQQQQQQQQQPTASWKDVYDFWTTRTMSSTCTNNGAPCTSTTNTFIWDLMEPALRPLQKHTQQLVNDVLALISNAMENDSTTEAAQTSGVVVANVNDTSLSSSISSSSCRPNFSRSLALQPIQAIWLVYFCLLDETQRYELLSSIPASSFIFKTTTTASSGSIDNNDKNKVEEATKEEDDNDEMTSNRAIAAREQLLATAETLRLFLEIQDE